MSYPKIKIKKVTKSILKWNPLLEGRDIVFRYFDLSCIDKAQKRIIDQEVIQINGVNAPSRARQLVHSNDILVSTVRPNLNGVAKIGKTKKNDTASTGFSVLRVNERLDESYLFYWIQSSNFISDMMRKATGANYPAVSDKIIKESKIPLPPLETQQHIAAILDDAVALRDKTAQLLKEYDLLAQSIFLEMFGDRESLKKRILGETTTLLNSKRIPVKSADRDKMKSVYPYYGASGIIDYVDDYLFNEKCLLIGEDGANLISRTTPIAFIAKGKYWVNNHAHVISGKSDLDIIYLMYYMNSINLEPYITGSAQPKLNSSNLKKILIPIPSKILQNQFAEKIAIIEHQKELAKQELKESEDLFNCLLQKAFKGELVS